MREPSLVHVKVVHGSTPTYTLVVSTVEVSLPVVSHTLRWHEP